MSVFDRSGNSHKVLHTRTAAAVTATGTDTAVSHSAKHVVVDLRVSAVSGTSPSLTPRLERLGSDGNWYTIWTGTAMTAVGNQSANIGPGLTTAVLPVGQVRLAWTVTGTTPSLTLAASIQGI